MVKSARQKTILEHIAPEAVAEHRHMMELIGEVAREWATLEHILCHAFVLMARTTQEVGTIIFFTPNSFRARHEILSNIISHSMLDGKEKVLVQRYMSKLLKLNTSRNSIIHATWDFSVGVPLIGTKSETIKSNVDPKKQPYIHSEKADTTSIKNHISAVKSCWRLFDLFSSNIPGFKESHLREIGLTA